MSDLCKEIAKMGKGIGNENRYRILEALMKGPRTVGEIAKKVGLPQPAVSQHLKVLKSATLVEDTRQGQEVLYSVNVVYMASLLKKLAADLSKKK
ncbi:MAG: metalloregulator ArsR/SmtB family transcription factor [Candidatus Sungbacteria bacterium]|nr:metalloregulator ArsR/SmtB family transcription factor [bacterium]MDZ4285419.1 metalloregulator ArsR/SmtB family transcription factor [Candidatus Sungbacteria bacterium]